MLLLGKLGFQNMFRHSRRTFLTALAILIAVGAITYMLCHIVGILDTVLNDYIRLQSGHIRIINPAYRVKERLLPLKLNVPDVTQRLKEIRQIPGIRLAVPRIRFGGLLSYGDNNQGGVGIGILPGPERGLLDIDKDIKAGGKLTPGGMVIGAKLADKLGVKRGDEVTVLSQTKYHSIAAGNFKITGILSTGFDYIDRSTYYINLREAQEMLDMPDQATELVIKLAAREDTERLVRKLEPIIKPHNLITLTWMDQGGIAQTLKTVYVSMALIMGIVLVLAGLTIANTMMMSVMERTREIGTLLALGMRPFQVVVLFLWEGFFIGLLGSFLGAGLGSLITLYIQKIGIHIGSAAGGMSIPIGQVLYPRFFWGAPLYSMLFGLVITVLASLLPAYKASKMLPREAML